MAVHWQLNVERRNQIELFCATFSSFTLASMQEPWNWFACVAVALEPKPPPISGTIGSGQCPADMRE